MRRYIIVAAVLFGAGSVAQAQVELKNCADANKATASKDCVNAIQKVEAAAAQ